MSKAVAVIETVSNQAFIFGTNRLREAVGASEMIYAAGVDLVLEALGYDDNAIEKARKSGGLKKLLEDKKKKKDGIEPLLIASGKAILIGPEERLKDIIRKVALKALDELPGITVQGAIAEWKDENSAKSLHQAIAETHRKLNRLRSRLPANDLRFQRLPVVAECLSSGLPAFAIDSDAPDDMTVVSEPVKAKRRYKKRGWKRLGTWLTGVPFARSIDDMEEILQSRDARWLAVIHADGNGLGQIFLNFLNGGEGHTVQEYIEKYRNFSLALDECTISATRAAFEKTEQLLKTKERDQDFRIIPLIIGGDDLTVVCDGAMAVPFAAAFLRHFEEETQRHEGIRAVLSDRGLSAAAGIAIVKPHFPFHRAYELAEALLKSAKQVKEKAEGCSALHYHVHFDSSGADWDRIKKRLDVPGENGKQAHLSVQPWVIAPCNADSEWAKKRSIEHLKRACRALQERNDDDDEQRLRLPRSQQHALRDKLFHGAEIAENKFRSIRGRYQEELWKDLLPQTGGQKLFFEEKDKGENEEEKIVQRTPLLDVMDLVDVGVQWPDDGKDDSDSTPDSKKEEAPA